VKIKEIIETLQIVAKYATRSSDQWCQGEHDALFLPLANDAQISTQDEARLLQLGAFRSNESDTWALFT
jgi:hypothetical protein